MLFALPTELRLRIYEEVLRIPSDKVRLREGMPWDPLPPSVLSLLQTCKKVHAEAEPVFYSINHLHFKIEETCIGFKPEEYYDFGRTAFSDVVISSSRRNAIKKLTVAPIALWHVSVILKDLETAAPNLQELFIECWKPDGKSHLNPLPQEKVERLEAAMRTLPALRKVEFVTPSGVEKYPGEFEQRKGSRPMELLLNAILEKRLGTSAGL